MGGEIDDETDIEIAAVGYSTAGQANHGTGLGAGADFKL